MNVADRKNGLLLAFIGRKLRNRFRSGLRAVQTGKLLYAFMLDCWGINDTAVIPAMARSYDFT